MKKLICFPLFAFFVLGMATRMQAQCTSEAGSMDHNLISVCSSETITATFNNDATLDANDVLQFVLHSSSGNSLGTIFSIGSTLDFTLQSGMQVNQTYFISAVAGDNDGSGNVDLADECLSVAPGTPVKFTQPFFEGCGSGILTCNNTQTWLHCYLTGAGHFDLTWSKDGVFFSNDSTIVVTEAGDYELLAIDQNGCQNSHVVTVIEEITPPDLNIVATGELGCGNALSLSAETSVNAGYLWSNGATTAAINVSLAGEYCVTLTDQNNGCITTDCYLAEDLNALVIDLPATHNVSCGNEGVALTATPQTGSGTYDYAWSDTEGNVFANTQSVVVHSPGNFTVLVTDLGGCTGSATTVVTSDLVANAGPDLSQNCVGFNTLGIGTPATTTGPEIVYEWTGPNSFMSGLLNPEVSDPGIYTLKVINTAEPGCYSEDQVEILPNTLIPAEISVTYYGCDTVYLHNEGIEVNYPVIYQWLLPDGTLLDAQYNLFLRDSGTNSGVYQLLVTDPSSGCSESTSVIIDFQSMVCANIQGRVFRDEDNCQFDTGELGLSDFLIRFFDGTSTYYRYTQNNGFYDAELPLGTYSVSVVLPNNLWLPCQPSYVVTINSQGEVTEQDLPLQHEVGCPELAVSVGTNVLRNCQQSNYWVGYNNYTGTEMAVDAQVTVTLDPFMTFVSATFPPSNIDGNVLTFDVGNLDVGDSGYFWITIALSCDAVLGQAHCVEALITPSEPCEEPDEMWSGASLRIDGACNEENDEVVFTIANKGTGDMVTASHFIVIEDGILFIPSPDTVQLDIDEEYDVILPANGSTYRVEVMQVPFHPGFSMPNATVEGCGTDNNGNFSTGFVTAFPPDDEDDFIDIDCRENVFSYDPNDKMAYPKGFGPEHYIEANTDLEYTIRFQNTGTDTAFRVVLRDTLSPLLDVTGIRVGTSSHRYTYNFEEDNILIFTFDNILLPDSTTNLAASQGFVTFRIDQQPDLPLQSRIENRAGIYFDYNEVVMTNTVFHEIGRDFLEVIDQVVNRLAPFREMLLAPNPTTGQVRIELDGPATARYQFSLFDSLGRPVYRTQIQGNTYVFDGQYLPPGLYFLNLEYEGNQVAGAKLIIHR